MSDMKDILLEEDDGIVITPVDNVNILYEDESIVECEAEIEEDEFFFEGTLAQEEKEITEE